MSGVPEMAMRGRLRVLCQLSLSGLCRGSGRGRAATWKGGCATYASGNQTCEKGQVGCGHATNGEAVLSLPSNLSLG